MIAKSERIIQDGPIEVYMGSTSSGKWCGTIYESGRTIFFSGEYSGDDANRIVDKKLRKWLRDYKKNAR